MNTIKKTYQTRKKQFEQTEKKWRKQNRLISLLRGSVFFGGIVLAYFLYPHLPSGLFVFTIILLVLVFLTLLQIQSKLTQKLKHLQNLIQINANELTALSGDYSEFTNGQEFIKYDHPYSYDLDIFGKGSIFQFINRTCSLGGKQKLAERLMQPNKNIEEIQLQQKAIAELSEMIDLRQNFRAAGISYSETKESKQKITDWTNETPFFFGKISFRIMLWTLPAIAILLIGLFSYGFISENTLIFYIIAQLMIVGFFFKTITQKHEKVSETTKLLQKYEKLLKIIEDTPFKSQRLTDLQQQLISHQQQPVSTHIKQLKTIVRYLDNRSNMVFAFISNGLFLWDIQWIYQLEKWQQTFKTDFEQWFSTIYQFDMLESLANHDYNHPSFIVPEFVDGDFQLEMNEGAHPLLDEKQRVGNDFVIQSSKYITIVTGANMAGKSTFLRTVGVNLILGMTGVSICAKKFKFTPTDLHTSVRTNDSLQKNESYFFAELKRLQEIIEEIKSGQKPFVIIDEMLRGTNSKDKHLGSKALIEQLVHLQTSGLVATHDIELGKLLDEYPNELQNKRFEVETVNNKLVFDYKIKSGISQNLNATFLMKKMGIIRS